MKILRLNFYHFLKRKTLILFLLISITTEAQDSFQLPMGKVGDKINFQLINNLIVIPVELMEFNCRG